MWCMKFRGGVLLVSEETEWTAGETVCNINLTPSAIRGIFDTDHAKNDIDLRDVRLSDGGHIRRRLAREGDDGLTWMGAF